MGTKLDVQIILKPYEYALAANVGARRVVTAIYRQSVNTNYKKGHGWEEHIEGACAEMAVAKYFNVYWDGSNGTYKLPDLAGTTQVRSTLHADGKLIVRHADDDECQYILVTGVCPEYTIRGYMHGTDAKNQKYLNDFGHIDRPAVFAIAQSELLDIATMAKL